MIDLLRIKAFIFVAENLSFSEAANQLHLTQPTISHHIKTLETDLSVELFDRSGSKLYLTEAGYTLLPRARKLIRQANELQKIMDSFDQNIVGHLRIACSTTAGKYILPLLAARFCERYPGIRVSILSCTPPHVVSRLFEGEANLGVVSYELCGNGLESQVFFYDTISLIVPVNHPWAVRQSIQSEELLEERIIIREATSGTRRVMLAGLAKHDITLDDLEVFIELGNAEAIVNTVAAGFGIAFASHLSFDCHLKRGDIVDVPVTGLEFRHKIFMVRREIEAPNRAQVVFWSFVHHPDNADLLQLAGSH